MQNIQSILDPNRFHKQEAGGRPINQRFEQAREFGSYVGINTILVLRLFKLYGMSEVLGIRSWLADCPYDNAKGGKLALAIWKLKENKGLNKKGVSPDRTYPSTPRIPLNGETVKEKMNNIPSKQNGAFLGQPSGSQA